MDSSERLSNSRWECKYHVVFIRKCRRKALFVELLRELGVVFRCLSVRNECRVLEAHLMPDHVHIFLSNPPKFAMSQLVCFIKENSAIHIARIYGEWIGEIKGQNAGWRGIKGGLQAPGGWVGGLEPGRFGKDLSVSTRISPFRAGSSSPGAWRGPPSGIGGGREPWDRPRGEIPS